MGCVVSADGAVRVRALTLTAKVNGVNGVNGGSRMSPQTGYGPKADEGRRADEKGGGGRGETEWEEENMEKEGQREGKTKGERVEVAEKEGRGEAVGALPSDTTSPPAGYSHPLDMSLRRGGSGSEAAGEEARHVAGGSEVPGDDVDEIFYPFGLKPMRPERGSQFVATGAPLPSNETFRLEVLRRYHLLDTDPEPKFDRLTALAAKMFKVPIALISLVDKDRQYFKSRHGLGVCETDRHSSFCAFTLLPSKSPCLIVEDTLADSRFSKNKLVVGDPKIRFYAGAPLLTSGGFILGSLCVIDYVPRKFGREEEELLLSLAHVIVMEIEKHTQSLELQREQAVRFEADRRGLLHAIDAFSEGLVLVDAAAPGQPIVFVNEGWERITGYSCHEAQGKNCGQLLQGPLTDPCAVSALRSACEAGRAAAVELQNYRRDGRPFWNWLRIRPVMQQPGAPRPRYYFGILSDCTARKEKELELEQIRLEALEKEASSRAKRQFVATISHEIRTPMNAIVACSQLLQDAAHLPPDLRELAEMIAGSGHQLLELINDILDFSKLDADKMALQLKEVSLWHCLDFCMEMLVLKSQTKGLDLAYNVEDSVPTFIWADEVRLRQILTNLLSNAAKFTEGGGEVEISVKACPRKTATSMSDYFDGVKAFESLPLYEIEFSVRDTGIGMPKEFCEIIFEAFTQCDNSRTRKYEGTGLGMAIAKDLVKRMGGNIWVESEVGKGAKETFHRMAGSMLKSWGMECTVAMNEEQFHELWGKPPMQLRRSYSLNEGVKVEAGDEGEADGVLGGIRAERQLSLNNWEKRPFDVVLVDSPISAISLQVCGAQLARHGRALAMMRLGCSCSAQAPTLLFLAKHSKAQAGMDLSKLANVTILSRPVRVKQVYQALIDELARDEAKKIAAKEAVEMAARSIERPLRILIAEDNMINQRVLLKLLKGLGQAKCVTANNGIKVLEHLRKQQFDLILMDVQMPEMDGLTATSHLRGEFPANKQPIISALTADVGLGIETECQEAGMNWYLSKPILKPELKILLDKKFCQTQKPLEIVIDDG